MSGTQSVERALKLITTIGQSRRPLTLAEIATSVDLHPSTAHRILQALTNAGFAKQDKTTSTYTLGQMFFQLAQHSQSQQNLAATCKPVIEALSRSTGESVGLLTRDEACTIVVVRVLSEHPLLVHSPVGTRGPLHATAVGRVLMAYMPEDDRNALLAKPLTKYTDNTPTDPSQLKELIASIHSKGVATGIDDYYVGVTTTAAPVRNGIGEIVAGISVTGPTSRMEEKLDELAAAVKASAQEASRLLGAAITQGSDAVPAN